LSEKYTILQRDFLFISLFLYAPELQATHDRLPGSLQLFAMCSEIQLGYHRIILAMLTVNGDRAKNQSQESKYTLQINIDNPK